MPKELDISKYIVNKSDIRNKYKLYGIINHQGVVEKGHYTCDIFGNDKLYRIDDHKVSESIDINSNILTDTAYILFYSHQK